MPAPVSVALPAIINSVAAPLAFRASVPLLSNVPVISSAAPLATDMVPAWIPAPVPLVIVNVPPAIANVALVMVFSSEIVSFAVLVTVPLAFSTAKSKLAGAPAGELQSADVVQLALTAFVH